MTILFADCTQERMELIVQRCVGWEMVYDEPLRFCIRCVCAKESMATKHPRGIRIDHEDRFAASVEQHRVRRFWTDAMEAEQFAPHHRPGPAEHLTGIAAVLRHVPAGKDAQSNRLLAKIACRSNAPLQPRQPHREQSLRCECSGAFELRDALLNISPMGSLRQNRPHHHFKWGGRRPPLLWTKRPQQSKVDRLQLASSSAARCLPPSSPSCNRGNG